MKKVHLIRHGEQLRSVNDPGLSERGRDQARSTGLYLASITPEGVAGIYASTKHRAMETAGIIRLTDQFRNTPILFERDLVEKKIIMENYSDKVQFLADWKRSLQDRSWISPDGESAIDAGNRMDNVLQSLPENDLQYIVVAHGGIIADLLRNQFPLDKIDQFRSGFSDIGKVTTEGLKHCSVTTLLLDGNRYSIEEVDVTRHLEGIGIGEGRPIAERK